MFIDSSNNTYILGTSNSWGGEFILYNQNAGTVLLPADTYSVVIVFSNATGGNLTTSDITFNISNWAMYEVQNVTSAPNPVQIAQGYGQANTPVVNYKVSGVFWGIYEGDRSYYQYDGNGVSQFVANDDFYWAGAVSDRGGYVYFGGDSGNIYARPVGAGFASGAGNVIALVGTAANPAGKVRSTIVLDSNSNNVYFTSTGTTKGLLWSIPAASLLTITSTSNAVDVDHSATSVSTPVVSQNGYLYIGANEYNSAIFATTGSVQAFDPLALTYLADVYQGDPVQASPIVYSDFDDYIYFTTNTSAPFGNVGGGYCYSFDGATANPEWSVLGTSGNTYAVQGFSSDNNCLVYGDDGNYLYIMWP